MYIGQNDMNIDLVMFESREWIKISQNFINVIDLISIALVIEVYRTANKN